MNVLPEVLRYFLNGLIATAVHYGVLTFNMEVLALPFFGLANFIAALFGVATSFLGSRYFVFRGHSECFVAQATKFSGLYGTIALLHGSFMLVWSDLLHLDYRLGFLLATGLQVSLSYVGNKFLVFKL